MNSFVDIITAWPNPSAFAEDVGVKVTLVASWKCRKIIPPERWRRVVESGQARGLDITLEMLARLLEEKVNGTAPPERPPDPKQLRGRVVDPKRDRRFAENRTEKKRKISRR